MSTNRLLRPKRILALILSVMMIAGLLPVGSLAVAAAPTGNLTISNTVAGETGSTASFEFRLEIRKSDGTIDTAINSNYGDLAFSNGLAQFNMQDGDIVTVSNLPAGDIFAVTQTELSGYITSEATWHGNQAIGTIVSGQTSSAAFVNTKTNIPTNIKIAEKKLTGNTLTANQFEFYLSPLTPAVDGENGYYTLGGLSDMIFLKNDADGNISLPSSVFTEDFRKKYCYDDQNLSEIFNGDYEFLLSEKNSGAANYTYDSHKYVISVTFVDGILSSVTAMNYTVSNGQYRFSTATDCIYTTSTLPSFLYNNAPNGYVAFNNTYTGTAAVVPDNIQIAKKVLTGKALTADQFEFTLTPLKMAVSGVNGYYTLGDSTDIKTLKNDASGAVYLSKATFNEAFRAKYCADSLNRGQIFNGDYTFLLSENNAGAANYTYDSHKYAISVTFVDGSLAGVTAMNYTVSNGQYRFSTSADSIYTTSTLPSFLYNNAPNGYVAFNNTYTGTAAAVPDNIQIAKKVLTGKALTADQFKFFLMPLKCDHAAGEDGYYTLGELTDLSILTNDAEGNIYIPKSVFTDDFRSKYCYNEQNNDGIFNGDYEFLLSEEDTGTAGYTYDTNQYVISVTFANGSLLAVTAMNYTLEEDQFRFEIMNGIFTSKQEQLVLSPNAAVGYVTFNNTYTGAAATVPDNIQIAKKVLSGKTLTAGQFEFTLTPLRENVGGENGYYTLGDSTDIKTLTNDADGNIYIPKAVFTDAFRSKYCSVSKSTGEIFDGDYEFLLSEKNTGISGYTYDDHTYAISVTFANGTLLAVTAMNTTEANGQYRFSILDGIFTSSQDRSVISPKAAVGYVTFNNDYNQKITLTYGADSHGSITEWMLKGDVDRGGDVNEFDVTASSLIDPIFGGSNEGFDKLVIESMDINGDGIANANDAVAIETLVQGEITLPSDWFTFRVVDTPKAGYKLDKVTITTPNNTVTTLTPAEPINGNYKLTIASDGTATVTGLSLSTNDVRFAHVSTSGSLTVSNVVSGSGADAAKYFDFTVTLGDRTINGKYGDMVFKNGVASFSLKHGQSITAINLPADVTYKTAETDSYDYNVSVTGRNQSGKIQANTAVTVVYNNYLGGQIIVPPVAAGTVTLTKVDSKDSTVRVSGAVYELHRIDAAGADVLVGAYTTNANGSITIYSLIPGNYYWVETSAPEGYVLDKTKHMFTFNIGVNSTATVTDVRTDVPVWLNGVDHYAYIVGCSDGLVHPEANITRAEVAAIFFRLLTDDVRDQYITKTNSFSDVRNSDWFCTSVSTMAAMGIVKGYPDGTFDPNGFITRAEFAAIAARFDSNGNKTDASFKDIYGHWGQKEISIAANNGWVLGYTDGTFKPDQLITRAEAMAMVNRVLQRVPELTSDLLDNMVKWPDNLDTSKWYYLAVQEATNSHYYDRKSNGYEKWVSLRPVRDWAKLEK